MTVTTIASLAAGLTRASSGNTATQAASLIRSLLNPGTAAQAAEEGANFTTALTLQNRVAQFRIASQNLAQTGAVLGAADAEAGAIEGDLDQLAQLATRAVTTTDTDERAGIATQFQAITKRIDARANAASLANAAQLSGASPQLRLATENKSITELTLGSLATRALFSGSIADVGSVSGAANAQSLIREAKIYVARQRETLKSLEKGLDLASSSLQTAIENQEAAGSTLGEVDLIATLLGNGSGAQQAQTANLPANILQLLNE